jgi:hypothetical protein
MTAPKKNAWEYAGDRKEAIMDLLRFTLDKCKRSVKGACRRSSPGVMMAAWQRQQRKCPLSA